MPGTDETSPEERLWTVLAQVPYGRVITYGRLAELAGLPRRARWVGTQLRQLPATSTLPWHRVVRADGQITQGEAQAALLKREHIHTSSLRVSLVTYGWPRTPIAGDRHGD